MKPRGGNIRARNTILGYHTIRDEFGLVSAVRFLTVLRLDSGRSRNRAFRRKMCLLFGECSIMLWADDEWKCSTRVFWNW